MVTKIMTTTPGAIQHRGSILPSQPAPLGLILGVLRFIDDTG